MSSLLGLIEMILVFSIALGWGVFELARLKRLRDRPAPPSADVDADAP